MEYAKDNSSSVTRDSEVAGVPAGMQYPVVPKKPRKRKKGRKSAEDEVIVPPEHLVAGVG